MENNIWTALITGVVLYGSKEWIRLYVDTRIANTKLNLETLYPIYTECFISVKKMIGAYRTPFTQEGTFERVNQDLLKDLNQEYQDLYLQNINYRKLLSLKQHIRLMEELKHDFNNIFSTNQVFFDYDFVAKTIECVHEYESDLSYLNNMVDFYVDNEENLNFENIFTHEYKRKVLYYERYLDSFEDQFRKRFKLGRESKISIIKRRWKRFLNKMKGRY
ncbi:hypothetical protein BUZ54_03735 [Staphylococcus hominis]|uniref:hypothetical protein n=1 Tax=Staphylococcus hominis TaxID=1290 RepID=UPI000D1E99F7|nr:hypothetical protein [Staphylococcus hominis]MEB5793760.1 hypothetical protein [Staphylococcus hominis]PTK26220.1 hypothetical protein BUZ54_03735 [Staphylococcus hominis]